MATTTERTDHPTSGQSAAGTPPNSPRDGERFSDRHIGPREDDVRQMLDTMGYDSLDALIDAVVPSDIRDRQPLNLPPARTEHEVLALLETFAATNTVFRSYIGMGYSDCRTPPVIQRNILENPGWYTAYTPYQAEIAQGRLEALLNFQTMVADLTGLEIANASLLDEATAAAEAMTLAHSVSRRPDAHRFLIDAGCHPQTIAVVQTRAEVRGIETVVGQPAEFQFNESVFGALVQYPSTEGRIEDFQEVCNQAHAVGALVTAATDLLALALLVPPGEWGADIAVGNSQRFGVPLGYGGPHAAFFATRDAYKRQIPGRIIGVSKDRHGQPALRMALQTREQHIRRDKATSNICTAQVLLSVIASMYAVYHGPDGIRRIAERVHRLARRFAEGVRRLGYETAHDAFFDTVAVNVGADQLPKILAAALDRKINLRQISATRLGLAFDETTTDADLSDLLLVFNLGRPLAFDLDDVAGNDDGIPAAQRRASPYLTHAIFHRHRSETEMLRYLKRLESKDLSLTAAMIPLGSCTMKLNATAEMMPITWAGFAGLHPFVPRDQAEGYTALFQTLEAQLAEITGLAAVSLQPNAGSQGEFCGLLTIRAYHRASGEPERTTCLIPQSAHGTNPASAVMAGMKVVAVATDAEGNIDIDDLRAKAEKHRETLGALMVTYPSTHGVFEAGIREVCDVIHTNGGQVYMDGANLNAQVGLCRPGDIGADVCHLNLHKTFCIPHGGGGPGMGPIAVAAHLERHLPDHPVVPLGREASCGTISAAPWGSPSILPISWAYLALMGPDGLTEATRIAILNANYVAHRLKDHFPLLYSGAAGLIAHECILDTRPFKRSAEVDVEDVAKRLIDFGFHPPTVSFPVPGTLMVEPTESEPKAELDRFCDAMIAIREEIREIEDGRAERGNNVLSYAPHTIADVCADTWDRPYTRERAGLPTPETREHKVWPPVGRIDSAYGDRHLICSCPPMETYEDASLRIGSGHALPSGD